jgi:cell division septation protein DedD
VIDGRDEPVHYEISVTGRQAAAFFLTLIVALGVAFFLGMKTGAAGQRAANEVSVRAVEPVAAPPAPAETIAEIRPPVERSRSRGAAPTPVPPTPAPRPQPSPTPSPVPTASPAPTLPPSPVPPSPVPVKTVAAPEKLWVQVFVTKSAAKADQMAAKLRAEAFKTDVSLVPDKEGLFRVRVGPYPDRPQAEAAAKKVQTSLKLVDKPLIKP